jgi:hypothetical protein
LQFKVQGSGFKVQGKGFRCRGYEFWLSLWQVSLHSIQHGIALELPVKMVSPAHYLGQVGPLVRAHPEMANLPDIGVARKI